MERKGEKGSRVKRQEGMKRKGKKRKRKRNGERRYVMLIV